jgi:ribonuclease J
LINKKKNSIKLAVLGGIGEFGKNMYIVEVDDDIFVLDAGLMLPEEEMLGIDVVIPDITYLIENKNRVKAIILSHGHEDHIGALPYVLRKLEVPVFGTKLTLAIAKENLQNHLLVDSIQFNEIDSDTTLRFRSTDLSFFRTNHSIPDSVGICIHTSLGAIVYTGDFKIDHTASILYKSEIGKMAKIGESGVLCLLSDSTEAERPGFTVTDAIVRKEISAEFYNAKGRIITACFASDLNRIQHILDISIEQNRKIVMVGKSLNPIYNIAVELGYLDIPEGLIIPYTELAQYPDDKLVILIIGIKGEPFETLQNMAKKVHKQINIQQGDFVLITGSPIRGSELALYKTMDMVYRAGATVLSGKRTTLVSSHGSQEELKFMINLMQPKHFIPVHGEYRMLNAHVKIAKDVGIPIDHIIIPEKGEVFEINENEIVYSGKIPSGNVLIDGNGVGDVGNIVLRDRKLLSQNGIIIVVVTMKKSEKRIVSGPEVISRGFVYVRESEKLLEESKRIVEETFENRLKKETFDWGGIKQEIRDILNQYLYEKTKRRPMILPIIIEI